jgi:hypothetical protein
MLRAHFYSPQRKLVRAPAPGCSKRLPVGRADAFGLMCIRGDQARGAEATGKVLDRSSERKRTLHRHRPQGSKAYLLQLTIPQSGKSSTLGPNC